MQKVELDRRTAAALHMSVEDVRVVTAAFLQETANALVEEGTDAAIQLEGLGTVRMTRRTGSLVGGKQVFLKYYVSLRRANSLARALRAKFGTREAVQRG